MWVCAFAGALMQQGLRHGGSGGQGQADALLLEQNGFLARDQGRIQLGFGKRIGAGHPAQKLHIGGQADDVGLCQSLVQPRQRLFARVTVHDELGHHGVVEGADDITLPHAGIDPHSAAFKCHALGQAVHMQCARGGQEVVVGVFGADARLDGVAGDLQLVLQARQWFARGHTQLPLDQVLAGNGFGNGVLDLQARVHFHEEEFHLLGVRVAAGLLDDEFHRACAHVLHRTRCGHRRLAHARAQLGCHAGRRGFFQHLLVAALHRAIALEKVHVVALGVAKHLDFDVARALHIFFDQHGVVAKAVDGFALARCQRGGKVLGLVHGTHTLATAARTGLDEHRVANAVGLGLKQSAVLVGTVVARHQGHTGLFHELLGLGLEAHVLDGRRRRADEHQPGVRARLGKVFVLAQEAVTGVDGLGTGGFRRFDDALPAKVAVLGSATADVHGLVTHGDMLGVGVGVGTHGNGFHAHTTGGGRNAAGDFTAVGNQDFFKHMGSPR